MQPAQAQKQTQPACTASRSAGWHAASRIYCPSLPGPRPGTECERMAAGSQGALTEPARAKCERLLVLLEMCARNILFLGHLRLFICFN